MDKIIVLEGNVADRKRELNKIKKSLDDHELFIFDKEDNYDYVSQIVTELSCFGQLRLFIIKELPRIEAPNASQERAKVLNRFKKLFSSVPTGNVVVFDSIGLSAESFFKEVRKYGRVHKFKQKINKDDARRKVNAFLKNKKIDFDHETVSLIVDSLNIGGVDVDIDKFYLLMKKVYNCISNKKKMVKEDVYDICNTSRDFIIWDLYNSLDSKDICSSLNSINDYLANFKNFQVESAYFLKSMVWRYGLLLMAKDGINNKKSQKKVAEEISNINKLECNGKGLNMKMKCKLKNNEEFPEYSSKVANSALGIGYGRSPLSLYSYSQLLLIYYSLIKILIKIRSGCTDAEIRIALQIIVLIICDKITKKNTIDGIFEHKKVLYRGINGRNI